MPKEDILLMTKNSLPLSECLIIGVITYSIYSLYTNMTIKTNDDWRSSFQPREYNVEASDKEQN